MDRVWVEDPSQWESICAHWLEDDALEWLAIDTEFERRTTFYPIFALLQVFDGKKIYLVDPQKISQVRNFKNICASPSIIKIMHAGKEDLEVLFHAWECRLNSFFDTQVVNAFYSGIQSVGYAALVKEVCDAELDKEQTQSDWLKRPLSEKQLSYAANDVLFLPQLYKFLDSKVKGQHYQEILEKELKELSSNILNSEFHEDDYRQAKDVSKLTPQELYVFRDLFTWREAKAISENRTRNHIFRDHQMVEICRRVPETKKQIQQIEGVHPRAVRVYGDEILELLKNVSEDASQSLPKVINPRDINGLKRQIDSLSKIVSKKASSYGIPAGLLLSKRLLKKTAVAMITNERLPESMKGWREDVLMADFRQYLSQLEPSN